MRDGGDTVLPIVKGMAVLDGEIVTLDENGRPKSYDLLRRRGAPSFYAFDCLWHDARIVARCRYS
jgi:ATP-dependent DNA ligase